MSNGLVGQPPDLSRILNDEATEHDDFGRSRFVAALADVIMHAQTPLVIALYGAWGSGKSSMMRQLRRRVESPESYSSGASTVWFDAWNNSADPNPSIALLHSIRQDLGLEGDPHMRHALLAIARAATDEFQIPYIGLRIGKIRELQDSFAEREFQRRSDQARLRQQFELVIQRARVANPAPLVVFIDDLDRCRPAAAVAVLDALKLYLNISGCVFVLGADRQALEAAIAAEYKVLDIAKESYLDKIVQLPFTIPPLDQRLVESFVRSHVPANLAECTEILVQAAPDNPRQLKRTINALVLHDRLAAHAHFPTDQPYQRTILAAIVLIQNVAPDLYQRIRSNPGDVEAVLPRTAGSVSTSRPRPEWLADMLKGSDTRLGLRVALELVQHPYERLNILPYLVLTESVAAEPVSTEPPRLRVEPEPQTPEAVGGDALERLRRSAEANPGNASVHSSLAGELWALGRYEDALMEAEAAVKINRDTLDRDPAAHPMPLAVSLNNVSYLLGALERYDDAKASALEALSVAMSPESPLFESALRSLINLVTILNKQENYEEALPYAEQAVEIARGNSRRDETSLIDWAGALRILSTAYEGIGRREDALTSATEAVAISREVLLHHAGAGNLDPASLELATSLRTLGGLLNAAGRHDESRAALREADDLEVAHRSTQRGEEN